MKALAVVSKGAQLLRQHRKPPPEKLRFMEWVKGRGEGRGCVQ